MSEQCASEQCKVKRYLKDLAVSPEASEWVLKAAEPGIARDVFRLYVAAAVGAQCLWQHDSQPTHPCPYQVGELIAVLVEAARLGEDLEITALHVMQSDLLMGGYLN